MSREPTNRSLERQDRATVIVAVGSHRDHPMGVDASIVEAADLSSAVSLINDGLRQGMDVLVVMASDGLSSGSWERAREVLQSDPRVATVSCRNGPSGDASIELLPFATGGVVLVSAVAVALVGPLEPGPPGATLQAMLADFSLRARARGFLDLRVTSGVGTEVDPSEQPSMIAEFTQGDRAWLQGRHALLLDGLARVDDAAPAASEPATPRIRVRSRLRVLIDDTTLGPYETGAQITTLAVIRSLAERDDVAELHVALGHHVPPYAREVMGLPKVEPAIRSGMGYENFGHYDVLHRTTQPDPQFSVAEARLHADRVVVSILDLIGYRVGTYFASANEWASYRSAIRHAVAAADAVTTISEDVAQLLELEKLPVDRGRLYPVFYGTDHLTGHENAEVPAGLANEHAGDEFVLCLGTDYLHKNRDVALAVHRELRARGRQVTMVLAGASVPFGSSRDAEREFVDRADDVIDLGSVRPTERNWLLRHAAVVLYPTSAEGFGLVPFEAARFGTPTVNVRFGPFVETLPDLPITLPAWDVETFADAVDVLLREPATRRTQIAAVLEKARRYTWERTANSLVGVYRALLEQAM